MRRIHSLKPRAAVGRECAAQLTVSGRSALERAMQQHAGQDEQYDPPRDTKVANSLYAVASVVEAPPPTPMSSPVSWLDPSAEHGFSAARPRLQQASVQRRGMSRSDGMRAIAVRPPRALGVQKAVRKPERKELSPAAFSAQLSHALGALAAGHDTTRSDPALRGSATLHAAMRACSLGQAGVP